MPQPNKKYVYRSAFGLFLGFSSLILFVSFTSFLLNWKEDQSELVAFWSREVMAQNALGKLGAWLGDLFIFHGVGIAAYSIPVILAAFAVKFLVPSMRIGLKSILWHALLLLIWLPLFMGLVFAEQSILQGVVGYELCLWVKSFIAPLGLGLLLFALFIFYLVFEWNITPEMLRQRWQNANRKTEEAEEEAEIEDSLSRFDAPDDATDEISVSDNEKGENDTNQEKSTKNSTENKKDNKASFDLEIAPIVKEKEADEPRTASTQEADEDEEDVELQIEETPKEEEMDSSDFGNTAVEKFGAFDPTLELSGFKLPPLDLLKKYDNEDNITIDQKELESNKNRIVETLLNYGIKIAQIKATIGPTVTLYEIIPEAGVRISKIKNLEDDIALSLSALGIRIIAPIPGRGTIGIEVPNTHTSIVSMRSVLASSKFQDNQKMALPIAFGKTISNETFVADLAKMPHLLMAGATGQGKSVGLNAIIASLLYKKHPAELKFVLVDPKKVELTLYNKIERHYLAKLPDSEEAIITDNQKVINTLNSLCIEMDQRYEMLKNAYVRNISEYNEKFKKRKLNPENGHAFLPYIVLVIDEFADLIMTAGKEVEMPIARLAQLARAVGIHLIVATQRPSVNVITGIIKANFPARVAFRVTSKIDSRTILDSGGADQLIGKGDMLFTTGNDLVRLQCAFVDTPEVDKITEYIGSQKAYPDAFLLPEYEGEDGGSSLDVNLDERDALFEDAAMVLVMAQQGSASLLQRKLKLGYNRAGRIIDQLEAAGVVGPFEGSKARQVLVPDERSLEQLLDNLNGN